VVNLGWGLKEGPHEKKVMATKCLGEAGPSEVMSGETGEERKRDTKRGH